MKTKEKAAKEYAERVYVIVNDKGMFYDYRDVEKAFLAGIKWAREKSHVLYILNTPPDKRTFDASEFEFIGEDEHED